MWMSRAGLRSGGTLVFGLLLGLSPALSPAAAQTAPGEPSPGRTEASLGAVDDLVLAVGAAAYGLREGSPAALVLAADLLGSLGASRERFQGTARGGEGTGTARGAARAGEDWPVLDAGALLAEARTLAEDDTHLLALIEGVEGRPRARGRVDGPRAYDPFTLQGGDAVWDIITFEAGQPAAVAVLGQGLTDLDCYALEWDAATETIGRVVASDENLADRCILTWVAGQRREYRVEVHNLGDRPNTLVAFTN